jgi:hypothetical protein
VNRESVPGKTGSLSVSSYSSHSMMAIHYVPPERIPAVMLSAGEGLLPAVSPLGDVMSHTKSNETRQSGHDGRLSTAGRPVKKLSMVSPELIGASTSGVAAQKNVARSVKTL